MRIHYFYKKDYRKGFYDLTIVAWLEEKTISRQGDERLSFYNPQNEMFRLLGTKRSFSQNETFFFSHP